MVNFPSVSSPTRFATSSAPPYSVSRLFGQLVAMRQVMVGCDCAIAGAATVAAAPAKPAEAFLRNDLRSMLPPPHYRKAGILVSIQPGTARREVEQRGTHVVDVRRIGLQIEIVGEVL